MDAIYYQFDGSDGCEICQAYSSDSYESMPARPHENCDCDINEITIDYEFDVDAEDPEFTLSHATSIDTYSLEREFVITNFQKLNDGAANVTYSREIDYEEDDIGPEIEEEFDVSDLRTGLSVDYEEEREVDAGLHTVTLIVEYQTSYFTVVYTATYKDSEVYEHEYTGTITTPIDYRVEWS